MDKLIHTEKNDSAILSHILNPKSFGICDIVSQSTSAERRVASDSWKLAWHSQIGLWWSPNEHQVYKTSTSDMATLWPCGQNKTPQKSHPNIENTRTILCPQKRATILLSWQIQVLLRHQLYSVHLTLFFPASRKDLLR